jgi:phosphopantetheinyl transferase
MISVGSPEGAHAAGAVTAYGTFGDRHGGRSYRAHSRAGVSAGRLSEAFCAPTKIPFNPPLVKGETDKIAAGPRSEMGVTASPAPPFVRGGREDFPCETEPLRHQMPLELEFLHHDPRVLCACIRLPCTNRNWRNWAKQAAVSALVPSVWEVHDEFRRDVAARVPNMEIVSDSLGKPHLLIDGSEGPAVSFAYEGDTMWVAVGREGSSVGIDAAESTSFRGKYPFHRAFHEGELELGGEKDEVAALIWSAKEAVVKALGCGFHLVDPLHLRVEPCFGNQQKYLLKVHLIDKSGEKFRMQAENPVPVSVFRYSSMWVSVASVSGAS